MSEQLSDEIINNGFQRNVLIQSQEGRAGNFGERASVNTEKGSHDFSKGSPAFKDLVDLESLRDTFERFSQATGFTTGLVSYPEQELLIKTGWRDICTKFHRACPDSEVHCKQSNIYLTSKLKALEELNIHPCENGLVDGATPIIIEGVHLASLATGQVLFEKPDIEQFKKQAEDYGYDVEAYLEALSQVPVVDEKKFRWAMAFLCNIAVMLAEGGLREHRLHQMEKERKRAEDALKESERKYRLLADNVTDVIWSLGMDLKYTYISPSIEYLRGYTSEEALKLSLEQTFTPVSYDKIIQVFSREMKRDEEAGVSSNRTAFLELEMIHKDGDIIPVEVSASLLRDESGSPIGIIGITRDITDRRQADEDRKKLQDQLNQAQKMEAIGTLAGGIAHDFNNILSGIIGYTELSLFDVEDRPLTKKKLERVLAAGNRAAELVKQILFFSRSHKGEVKPIRPAGIVKEVIKLMQASLPSTIEIKQSISSESYVLADATNIHQVLMNLCTNAAHAMEQKGGVLSVTVKDETLEQDDLSHYPDVLSGEFLKISVEDTGTGMTKDVQEKAFDPFFTTKELGKGTGIGLSTVHGIITELGGFVSLRSEPNQGTSIHIYIPLITKPAEIEERTADEFLKGGTERILLVDDEQIQIDLAKDALTYYGYQVTAFSDSTIALAHFQKNPDEYDLVITDMTMPKMTGDILAKKIHTKRPDIPVIMCTGFSEVMDEHKAGGLGISAFLYKPVVMKKMIEAVRKAVCSKR